MREAGPTLLMTWKVEVLSLSTNSRWSSNWQTLYDGAEVVARRIFSDIEAECMSNKRGHTEIKLWHGRELMLHIWWNRGMPNKPDGTRDWSR